MTMTDIPLPNLAAALRAQHGTLAPRYVELYRACLDGQIPAHQDRGRWYVKRDDLPRIAEILALPLAA